MKNAAAPSANSPLFLLAAIKFVVLLDFMILMPLGPALMRDLAITPRLFGVLVSSYTLASAVFGVLGARVLDSFERRSTILVLLAIFSAATVGTALGSSLWMLVLGRVVAGAASGLLWSAVMALLIDTYPPEVRGRALGVVMGAYSVAAVAGVPLGLLLSDHGNWRLPFVVVGIGALGIFGLCFLGLPRASKIGEAIDMSALDVPVSVTLSPRVMSGWILTFFVVFTGFLLIPYLATFMSENLGLRPREMALVYFAGGTASFFSARWIGELVDRVGARWVLSCLILLCIIPHQLFSRQTSSSLFIVVPLFILFMTLTSGRIIPTLELITRGVPAMARGRFMSINTSVGDLGCGLAALFAAHELRTDASGQLLGLEQLSNWSTVVGLFTFIFLHFFSRRGVEVSVSAATDVNRA